MAIRPETFAVSPEPHPHAPDCCQFEAVVRSYLPHGNVLRYTREASGVLFRSIQLFENGSRLYLSVKKKNCLVL